MDGVLNGSLKPLILSSVIFLLIRCNLGRGSLAPIILAILCTTTFCPQFANGLPLPMSSRAQEYANRGLQLAQAGDLENAEIKLRRAVELAPNDPIYLAGLGGVLGLQQRLEEANTYFEKALKIDPNNLVIRRNLARNQWQLGRLREAKVNLELILKEKPGDEQTILLLGMVAENLKDYATAVKLLESVQPIVMQRPESITALSRSYYRTGQREKAQETLNALLGHPAGPSRVFPGGQVAAEAADYETAEKLFTSIRSTYPDTAKLGYEIAFVQYRANRHRASQETLLDLIGAGHETSDIYNLLGWCYQKQDKLKQAVRAFDQAIDLEPYEESNYLDLGMILAKHNLLPVAVAVAKRALEMFPRSYRVHMLKGMIETRQDLYIDAVESYARAVELNPASSEANRRLAKAQSAAGMTQQATATFEKGLKRFPRDALHYQEYAVMLLQLGESGDTDAESCVLSLLETSFSLDDSLPETHYQLGNLALMRGKTKQALQYLQVAAKLDQEKSKIHYALARAYRRLGRREEASKELQISQRMKAEEDRSALGFPATGMPQNK